ncbi:hypothetical protein JCM10207_004052 [Rhodosporidiobolus poonsookiae]
MLAFTHPPSSQPPPAAFLPAPLLAPFPSHPPSKPISYRLSPSPPLSHAERVVPEHQSRRSGPSQPRLHLPLFSATSSRDPQRNKRQCSCSPASSPAEERPPPFPRPKRRRTSAPPGPPPPAPPASIALPIVPSFPALPPSHPENAPPPERMNLDVFAWPGLDEMGLPDLEPEEEAVLPEQEHSAGSSGRNTAPQRDRAAVSEGEAVLGGALW